MLVLRELSVLWGVENEHQNSPKLGILISSDLPSTPGGICGGHSYKNFLDICVSDAGR